jgi:hypothetical protein
VLLHEWQVFLQHLVESWDVVPKSAAKVEAKIFLKVDFDFVSGDVLVLGNEV